MTSPLPTGAVTFLFTDIEGSTRLWEQEPAAMQAALARHDLLLRDIVAAQGGQVVKTTGDGLHAVFALASHGAAAALACQQALAGEAWPGLSRPLRVRMGMHTGEAEFRDGDYFGAALNRAARLMSIAAGGQTLLSAATAELVRDQLPAGAALSDLGEQRLKDLSRPEHVFQLSGPGLPVDFPPLRSLNSLPHNLPLQLTSFIGREAEMAEAKRLLQTTRLLTLTGPGGTGKTRLSLQLAADVLEMFPAGAWLVELAPLSDPALLLQAVASVLNVREQPGRPLLEALTDYLRAKSLLLLLDNCEHLIDACARLVTDLLGACPSLKILPSSREALGVAGETAYRVPSLSLPDARQAKPEALMQSEALRLFVERARAAQPHFGLTERNLRAVAQVCQRLDGIPLALELAAARLRLFTVEQIAARLDDRFRLLTGGSRLALPRQQTLRALIDWSYDLLPASEQAALRRLSVFAGGWTFEAAEAVLGPQALDLLAHLVDKSLVVAEDAPQAEETRYRLLETIRQYGRDRLLEAGEAAAARDLHLQTYLQFALAAQPELEGAHMLSWLDRLQSEHDNLRAALEWAMDRSPQAALQLAAGLSVFWRSRGFITEGRRWLEASLARFAEASPPGQGEPPETMALRAKGLYAAGAMAFAQGELHAARSLLEDSVALARRSGAQRTLGEALGMLGFTEVWLGDAAAAQAVIEEGLRLSQETHNPRDMFTMKMVQANLALQIRGDFAATQTHFEEVKGLMNTFTNPWLASMSIMGLGMMAVLQGNYPEALSYYERGEKLFGEMGDEHMVIAMQSERAHVERQMGHFPQALALYAKTITRWQELGHRAALAHELECFAFIAIAQSQAQWAAQRAACLLGAAEALRESLDAPMRANERGQYDQNLAALHLQMDAGAFAAAWAQGRSLTMEQAVQLALQEGEGVTARQPGQNPLQRG